MLGMTSVTFRTLSADEILRLCAQSGLQGVEWGGDIHVPAGRADIAANVAAATRAHGLKVLSYGSYHRLCADMDFAPVLDTACALGVDKIRIWAGDKGSQQADAAHRERAAQELRRICGLARGRGVDICLEYHRNTLTDTCESAQALLRQAGCDNLFTYWQPNPDLPHEQRLHEIRCLLPHIRSVHVFQWSAGNVRQPLSAGEGEWAAYLQALGTAPRDCILEFVKDDSPEQFLADAKTLVQWTSDANARS